MEVERSGRSLEGLFSFFQDLLREREHVCAQAGGRDRERRRIPSRLHVERGAQCGA